MLTLHGLKHLLYFLFVLVIKWPHASRALRVQVEQLGAKTIGNMGLLQATPVFGFFEFFYSL